MMRTLASVPFVLLLAAPAWALGPQPPDQVDVFYKPPSKPNVVLLLDTSKSMRKRSSATFCPWFQTDPVVTGAVNGGIHISTDRMRKRIHQLKAALIGCSDPADGIIDRWHGQVNFEVRTFDGSTGILAPFGTSNGAMQSAVLNASLSSGTKMVRGLAGSLVDLQSQFDPVKQCRANAVVLMTDGQPTGSNPSFSGGASDGAACGSTYSVSTNKVHCGAGYMAGSPRQGGDGCPSSMSSPTQTVMCSLGATDEVLVQVHTIAFDTKRSAIDRMKKTAEYGQGNFYYADNVQNLDQAFDEVIRSTFTLAEESFQTGTVDLEGPFVYNHTFPTMFKPGSNKDHMWLGNLKKYCILPPLNPDGTFQSGGDCMYQADPTDATLLIANPNPKDLWTNNTAAVADQGGAGEILGTRVASGPNYGRKLAVWLDASHKLVPLHRNELSSDDIWLNGERRHHAINRLHGYTFESTGSGDPKNPASWALPETMNAKPVLLSYENGNRFLLYASNDGLLHVFDADTGDEVSAVMPKHVLSPASSEVANFAVRDLFERSIDRRHVFLLDGSPRLFHHDDDADGRIDPGENAKLVFALGRAGAAYYMFDANDLSTGLFDVSNDKPALHSLPRVSGSAYEDLGDTWSPPWLGQIAVGGNVKNVAIFGSGHEREYDEPTARAADAIPGPYVVAPPVGSPPHSIPCTTLIPSSTVASASALDCDITSPPYGPLDTTPVVIRAGPFSMPDGIAHRFRFSQMQLDPNDVIRVLGPKNEVIQTFTATVGSLTTQWVYGPSISVEFETDGNPTSHAGFVLDEIQWREQLQLPPRRRSPSLYVVDLDRWNGSSPVAWTDPSPSDLTHGLIRRFTADCGAHTTNCVDQGTQPDLKYMRCPISAEPAVLTVQNRVERLYVGDECGQIWRMEPDGSSWRVDRIFSVNDHLGTTWPRSGPYPETRQLRKFMTRLDLVRTRCIGSNAVGIYFGTGNIQRPTANDDPLGRPDVIGVLWDDGTLSSSTDLGDLKNVTATDEVDPTTITEKGWYLELRPNERMLRRPLVFSQTAYYKTYETTGVSGECTSPVGQNAFYVMDSCTAAAVDDEDGSGVLTASDRRAGAYSGQIGSDPNLLITRDTALVLGEKGSVVHDALDPERLKPRYRRTRMLHWRTNL